MHARSIVLSVILSGTLFCLRMRCVFRRAYVVKADMSKVKHLRQITTYGIKDCRDALVVTENNVEQALQHLKQKSRERAAKKLDRPVEAGLLFCDTCADHGVMISLRTETDFVPRTSLFQKVMVLLGEHYLGHPTYDTQALLESRVKNIASSAIPLEEDPAFTPALEPLQDVLLDVIGSVGENTQLGEIRSLMGNSLSFGHHIQGAPTDAIDDRLGTLGVIVAVEGVQSHPQHQLVTTTLARHIAASQLGAEEDFDQWGDAEIQPLGGQSVKAWLAETLPGVPLQKQHIQYQFMSIA